ncbi:helix-turn-helix domain-containing protein [Flexibacter flexilis]|nr:AraC family transcriptional regulator [Flexibacter flexilis]
MNQPFDRIQDTLSYFGVECRQPYYISTGNQLTDFPAAPFRMDYYSLCICSQGQIEVEIDNRLCSIGQNGMMVAAPSTIIHFLAFSKDFRMKLLFFDKNFLMPNALVLEDIFLLQNRSYSLIESRATESEKCLKLLQYLEQKTQETSVYKDEIVRTIIYYLLLETAELFQQSPQKQLQTKSATKDLYFRFVELVKTQARHHKDVLFYAETLCISSKYLIEIVRKNAGKTPSQIIDEALLKEACFLLNKKHLNISDIAYELNFSSVATFSRFFKKHTQHSPQQYREKQPTLR